MLFFRLIILLTLCSFQVFSYSGGSGTCEIHANYSLSFQVMGRTLNFNSGGYALALNTPYYSENEAIEITLNAAVNEPFIGIVFTVVDEMSNIVGAFVIDPGVIHACNAVTGNTMITHDGSTSGNGNAWDNVNSYTLFWMPPAGNIGKVYVIGYVLKGSRISNNPPQEFFRFVRDDGSAVTIQPRDVFTNSFE